LSISTDGTYDVTNKATAVVEVIKTVSSVPSEKATDIIYNTTDSSYYTWEYPDYLCFTAAVGSGRSSDTIHASSGESYTYYTQNTPV